MPEQRTIRLVDESGNALEVPVEQAADLIGRNTGYRVETGEDVAAQAVRAKDEEVYGGAAGAVTAGILGAARTATLGGSDILAGAIGGENLKRQVRKVGEAQPVATIGGEIAGLVLDPVGATALAARAGGKAARLVEGSGAASQIAGAGIRGATEGAIVGAGQGVSEVALSDDPVTLERAASVIGSNALFGAGTGGVLGAVGKGAEIGLRRAKTALDKYAAKGVDTVGDVGEDLASLDAKGLRTARSIEIDTINEARVPLRAAVADDLAKFRAEMKQNKVWLATKGAEDAEIRSIGARTLKADRRLDSLLDDPKALAESPKAALSLLRKQEAALDDLVTKHGEKLRTQFAADTSGARAAALDYAPKALEQNRALQKSIAELSGKPASARLDAIEDALSGVAKGKSGSTINDMLGQGALGYAVGSMAGIPYLGQAVVAGKAVAGVMRKLGANGTAAAARGAKALDVFLDVAAKAPPTTRIAATKVLSSVAYGPSGTLREKPTKKTKKTKKQDLATVYLARSKEIRELTAPGPDGAPVMRLEARQRMADRLAPIRAADPIAADRIETNKARAVEFLAEKLPRKPDLNGLGIGPDTWQPSDMEMRGWARYVAAVEDPHGVVERLATGEVTPEDAEAMREVYPEMFAQIQTDIMMRLGELQAKLPYQRRLALSIFSGVAVDPVLDPRVLASIQGAYDAEEGTEGGEQAPRPQPQFGSVSKPEPTPAQERGA